jgi:hypothetical protein
VTSIPTARVGKDAAKQARQISGHDEDGTPADRTITLDADLRDNRFQDLVVTNVKPGGAMDRFYGFKPGDKIIAIGDADIATLSNDDFEMAKAMLLQEGFEKSKPVTVIRDGQRMQLPESAASPAAAVAPNAASGQPTAAAPAPAASSTNGQPADDDPARAEKKSLTDQLKAVGVGAQ